MKFLDCECIIGFDTETTGLDVQKSRIVEAALVRRGWKKDGLADTIQNWLIDPGIEIPSSAQKIHGISNDVVQNNGLDPKVSLDNIASEICKQAEIGNPIVIYNAGYDLGILKYELDRYGLRSLEDRIGRAFKEVLDPYVLDLIFDPHRHGRRNLKAVAEVHGVVSFGEMHRASADAQIALDVLQAITVEHPELKDMSYEELYAFQEVGLHSVIHDEEHLTARGAKPTHTYDDVWIK